MQGPRFCARVQTVGSPAYTALGERCGTTAAAPLVMLGLTGLMPLPSARPWLLCPSLSL